MEPIRICFIAPKAYPLFNPAVSGVFGGTEVDLYFLATELAGDKNYAVSFITADYGQPDVEIIQGVRVIKSLDFRRNALSGAARIWRGMRAADARVYFLEGVSMGTFLVATFCRLYHRIFVYRTAHRYACDGTYLRRHFSKGRVFRWSLRKANQVIVQNDSDRENLRRTIGVESIVIPNAHRLPEMKNQPRETILWVGRSVSFKRPELFLELAKEVPQERFTMICQKATGDTKYDELVSRARKVKNLQFIPRVGFGEILSYFQRAKLLVSTSEAEGFPNVFVQACVAGTPILSLNVNPDDFLGRYECGVCANGNWQVLVAKLRELLASERLVYYGKNARKYAEERHDIKEIVGKYKELFQSLIEQADTY